MPPINAASGSYYAEVFNIVNMFSSTVMSPANITLADGIFVEGKVQNFQISLVDELKN